MLTDGMLWCITARRPQQANSFKLAAIVNVDGLKVQILAIDHPVAKVIEHLKARPDGTSIVLPTPRYICECSVNRVVPQDQYMRAEVSGSAYNGL